MGNELGTPQADCRDRQQCVYWSLSSENGANFGSADFNRHIRVAHDRQLSGCPVQLQSEAVRGIRQRAQSGCSRNQV